MKPRTILLLGWLAFLLYAYPGHLSYDSVLQLQQARAGVYGGGHPPMMGVLWAITDSIVAGAFGMLVIQSTCLLVGAYLLLRRAMSDRAAAICAGVLLCLPPVAAVMAVIWKDSQMAGFLALGAALLLSPRLAARLVGLALMSAATAMRYNALAITLPLVVLLFVWSPSHRWWLRYLIAIGAWVIVTFAAMTINDQLTSVRGETHLWHDSMALLDLTGTLRYAPDLTDDDLRADLAGTPLIAIDHIQDRARRSYPASDLPQHEIDTFGTGHYIPALWITTYHVFAKPTTPAERDAISRAWRTIVLGHPGAYLAYRWHVFRELVHLGDRTFSSGAYVWFTDILDLQGSAKKLGYTASQSRLQFYLHEAMYSLGSSWLFRPYIYLLISLLLVPLCIRHRDLLALVASGVANQAALFVLAPTTDYRYSFWVVVTTVVAVMMLITRRAATSQTPNTTP